MRASPLTAELPGAAPLPAPRHAPGLEPPGMAGVRACAQRAGELQGHIEELSDHLLACLDADAVTRDGLAPLGEHLLRRWCHGLLLGALQWLEHGAQPGEMSVPTVVFALARAAAEQDVPWSVISRGHQIAHGELLSLLVRAICPGLPPEDAAAVATRLIEALSRFLLQTASDAERAHRSQWSESRLTAPLRRRRRSCCSRGAATPPPPRF
jgi:hypothetical protein